MDRSVERLKPFSGDTTELETSSMNSVSDTIGQSMELNDSNSSSDLKHWICRRMGNVSISDDQIANLVPNQNNSAAGNASLELSTFDFSNNSTLSLSGCSQNAVLLRVNQFLDASNLTLAELQTLSEELGDSSNLTRRGTHRVSVPLKPAALKKLGPDGIDLFRKELDGYMCTFTSVMAEDNDDVDSTMTGSSQFASVGVETEGIVDRPPIGPHDDISTFKSISVNTDVLLETALSDSCSAFHLELSETVNGTNDIDLSSGGVATISTYNSVYSSSDMADSNCIAGDDGKGSHRRGSRKKHSSKVLQKSSIFQKVCIGEAENSSVTTTVETSCESQQQNIPDTATSAAQCAVSLDEVAPVDVNLMPPPLPPGQLTNLSNASCSESRRTKRSSKKRIRVSPSEAKVSSDSNADGSASASFECLQVKPSRLSIVAGNIDVSVLSSGQGSLCSDGISTMSALPILHSTIIESRGACDKVPQPNVSTAVESSSAEDCLDCYNSESRDNIALSVNDTGNITVGDHRSTVSTNTFMECSQVQQVSVDVGIPAATENTDGDSLESLTKVMTQSGSVDFERWISRRMLTIGNISEVLSDSLTISSLKNIDAAAASIDLSLTTFDIGSEASLSSTIRSEKSMLLRVKEFLDASNLTLSELHTLSDELGDSNNLTRRGTHRVSVPLKPAALKKLGPDGIDLFRKELDGYMCTFTSVMAEDNDDVDSTMTGSSQFASVGVETEDIVDRPPSGPHDDISTFKSISVNTDVLLETALSDSCSAFHLELSETANGTNDIDLSSGGVATISTYNSVYSLSDMADSNCIAGDDVKGSHGRGSRKKHSSKVLQKSSIFQKVCIGEAENSSVTTTVETSCESQQHNIPDTATSAAQCAVSLDEVAPVDVNLMPPPLPPGQLTNLSNASCSESRRTKRSSKKRIRVSPSEAKVSSDSNADGSASASFECLQVKPSRLSIVAGNIDVSVLSSGQGSLCSDGISTMSALPILHSTIIESRGACDKVPQPNVSTAVESSSAEDCLDCYNSESRDNIALSVNDTGNITVGDHRSTVSTNTFMECSQVQQVSVDVGIPAATENTDGDSLESLTKVMTQSGSVDFERWISRRMLTIGNISEVLSDSLTISSLKNIDAAAASIDLSLTTFDIGSEASLSSTIRSEKSMLLRVKEFLDASNLTLSELHTLSDELGDSNNLTRRGTHRVSVPLKPAALKKLGPDGIDLFRKELDGYMCTFTSVMAEDNDDVDSTMTGSSQFASVGVETEDIVDRPPSGPHDDISTFKSISVNTDVLLETALSDSCSAFHLELSETANGTNDIDLSSGGVATISTYNSVYSLSDMADSNCIAGDDVKGSHGRGSRKKHSSKVLQKSSIFQKVCIGEAENSSVTTTVETSCESQQHNIPDTATSAAQCAVSLDEVAPVDVNLMPPPLPPGQLTNLSNASCSESRRTKRSSKKRIRVSPSEAKVSSDSNADGSASASFECLQVKPSRPSIVAGNIDVSVLSSGQGSLCSDGISTDMSALPILHSTIIESRGACDKVPQPNVSTAVESSSAEDCLDCYNSESRDNIALSVNDTGNITVGDHRSMVSTNTFMGCSQVQQVSVDVGIPAATKNTDGDSLKSLTKVMTQSGSVDFERWISRRMLTSGNISDVLSDSLTISSLKNIDAAAASIDLSLTTFDIGSEASLSSTIRSEKSMLLRVKEFLDASNLTLSELHTLSDELGDSNNLTRRGTHRVSVPVKPAALKKLGPDGIDLFRKELDEYFCYFSSITSNDSIDVDSSNLTEAKCVQKTKATKVDAGSSPGIDAVSDSRLGRQSSNQDLVTFSDGLHASVLRDVSNVLTGSSVKCSDRTMNEKVTALSMSSRTYVENDSGSRCPEFEEVASHTHPDSSSVLRLELSETLDGTDDTCSLALETSKPIISTTSSINRVGDGKPKSRRRGPRKNDHSNSACKSNSENASLSVSVDKVAANTENIGHELSSPIFPDVSTRSISGVNVLQSQRTEAASKREANNTVTVLMPPPNQMKADNSSSDTTTPQNTSCENVCSPSSVVADASSSTNAIKTIGTATKCPEVKPPRLSIFAGNIDCSMLASRQFRLSSAVYVADSSILPILQSTRLEDANIGKDGEVELSIRKDGSRLKREHPITLPSTTSQNSGHRTSASINNYSDVDTAGEAANITNCSVDESGSVLSGTLSSKERRCTADLKRWISRRVTQRVDEASSADCSSSIHSVSVENNSAAGNASLELSTFDFSGNSTLSSSDRSQNAVLLRVNEFLDASNLTLTELQTLSEELVDSSRLTRRGTHRVSVPVKPAALKKLGPDGIDLFRKELDGYMCNFTSVMADDNDDGDYTMTASGQIDSVGVETEGISTSNNLSVNADVVLETEVSDSCSAFHLELSETTNGTNDFVLSSRGAATMSTCNSAYSSSNMTDFNCTACVNGNGSHRRGSSKKHSSKVVQNGSILQKESVGYSAQSSTIAITEETSSEMYQQMNPKTATSVVQCADSLNEVASVDVDLMPPPLPPDQLTNLSNASRSESRRTKRSSRKLIRVDPSEASGSSDSNAARSVSTSECSQVKPSRLSIVAGNIDFTILSSGQGILCSDGISTDMSALPILHSTILESRGARNEVPQPNVPTAAESSSAEDCLYRCNSPSRNNTTLSVTNPGNISVGVEDHRSTVSTNTSMVNSQVQQVSADVGSPAATEDTDGGSLESLTKVMTQSGSVGFEQWISRRMLINGNNSEVLSGSLSVSNLKNIDEAATKIDLSLTTFDIGGEASLSSSIRSENSILLRVKEFLDASNLTLAELHTVSEELGDSNNLTRRGTHRVSVPVKPAALKMLGPDGIDLFRKELDEYVCNFSSITSNDNIGVDSSNLTEDRFVQMTKTTEVQRRSGSSPGIDAVSDNRLGIKSSNQDLATLSDGVHASVLRDVSNALPESVKRSDRTMNEKNPALSLSSRTCVENDSSEHGSRCHEFEKVVSQSHPDSSSVIRLELSETLNGTDDTGGLAPETSKLTVSTTSINMVGDGKHKFRRCGRKENVQSNSVCKRQSENTSLSALVDIAESIDPVLSTQQMSPNVSTRNISGVNILQSQRTDAALKEGDHNTDTLLMLPSNQIKIDKSSNVIPTPEDRSFEKACPRSSVGTDVSSSTNIIEPIGSSTKCPEVKPPRLSVFAGNIDCSMLASRQFRLSSAVYVADSSILPILQSTRLEDANIGNEEEVELSIRKDGSRLKREHPITLPSTTSQNSGHRTSASINNYSDVDTAGEAANITNCRVDESGSVLSGTLSSKERRRTADLKRWISRRVTQRVEEEVSSEFSHSMRSLNVQNSSAARNPSSELSTFDLSSNSTLPSPERTQNAVLLRVNEFLDASNLTLTELQTLSEELGDSSNLTRRGTHRVSVPVKPAALKKLGPDGIDMFRKELDGYMCTFSSVLPDDISDTTLSGSVENVLTESTGAGNTESGSPDITLTPEHCLSKPAHNMNAVNSHDIDFVIRTAVKTVEEITKTDAMLPEGLPEPHCRNTDISLLQPVEPISGSSVHLERYESAVSGENIGVCSSLGRERLVNDRSSATLQTIKESPLIMGASGGSCCSSSDPSLSAYNFDADSSVVQRVVDATGLCFSQLQLTDVFHNSSVLHHSEGPSGVTNVASDGIDLIPPVAPAGRLAENVAEVPSSQLDHPTGLGQASPSVAHSGNSVSPVSWSCKKAARFSIMAGNISVLSPDGAYRSSPAEMTTVQGLPLLHSTRLDSCRLSDGSLPSGEISSAEGAGKPVKTVFKAPLVESLSNATAISTASGKKRCVKGPTSSDKTSFSSLVPPSESAGHSITAGTDLSCFGYGSSGSSKPIVGMRMYPCDRSTTADRIAPMASPKTMEAEYDQLVSVHSSGNTSKHRFRSNLVSKLSRSKTTPASLTHSSISQSLQMSPEESNSSLGKGHLATVSTVESLVMYGACGGNIEERVRTVCDQFGECTKEKIAITNESLEQYNTSSAKSRGNGSRPKSSTEFMQDKSGLRHTNKRNQTQTHQGESITADRIEQSVDGSLYTSLANGDSLDSIVARTRKVLDASSLSVSDLQGIDVGLQGVSISQARNTVQDTSRTHNSNNMRARGENIDDYLPEFSDSVLFKSIEHNSIVGEAGDSNESLAVECSDVKFDAGSDPASPVYDGRIHANPHPKGHSASASQKHQIFQSICGDLSEDGMNQGSKTSRHMTIMAGNMDFSPSLTSKCVAGENTIRTNPSVDHSPVRVNNSEHSEESQATLTNADPEQSVATYAGRCGPATTSHPTKGLHSSDISAIGAPLLQSTMRQSIAARGSWGDTVGEQQSLPESLTPARTSAGDSDHAKTQSSDRSCSDITNTAARCRYADSSAVETGDDTLKAESDSASEADCTTLNSGSSSPHAPVLRDITDGSDSQFTGGYISMAARQSVLTASLTGELPRFMQGRISEAVRGRKPGGRSGAVPKTSSTTVIEESVRDETTLSNTNRSRSRLNRTAGAGAQKQESSGVGSTTPRSQSAVVDTILSDASASTGSCDTHDETLDGTCLVSHGENSVSEAEANDEDDYQDVGDAFDDSEGAAAAPPRPTYVRRRSRSFQERFDSLMESSVAAIARSRSSPDRPALSPIRRAPAKRKNARLRPSNTATKQWFKAHAGSLRFPGDALKQGLESLDRLEQKLLDGAFELNGNRRHVEIVDLLKLIKCQGIASTTAELHGLIRTHLPLEGQLALLPRWSMRDNPVRSADPLLGNLLDTL